MTRAAALAAAFTAVLISGADAQWQLQPVPTVGPVKAIETVDGEPAVAIGHGRFRVIAEAGRIGRHRGTAAAAATARRAT